jgi:hypothetical protein
VILWDWVSQVMFLNFNSSTDLPLINGNLLDAVIKIPKKVKRFIIVWDDIFYLAVSSKQNIKLILHQKIEND